MMTFTSKANVKIKTRLKHKPNDEYFCMTEKDVIYLHISEDTEFIYKIKISATGFDIFDFKGTGYKMIPDFPIKMVI